MSGGDDLQIRQLCLVLAGALCLGALVLTLSTLSGGGDIEDRFRPVVVAFVFALFSLPAATGIYLAWSRPGLAIVGVLTALVALGALIAVLVAYWSGGFLEGGGEWKTAAIFMFLSVGSGQVSLILALARDDDSDIVRIVRFVALLPITVLVILAISEISNSGSDVDSRVFAIFSILYLLCMAVLPLLQRATRLDQPPA